MTVYIPASGDKWLPFAEPGQVKPSVFLLWQGCRFDRQGVNLNINVGTVRSDIKLKGECEADSGLIFRAPELESKNLSESTHLDHFHPVLYSIILRIVEGRGR